MQTMQFQFLCVLILFLISAHIKCGMAETCDRKHVTVAEMKDIVIGRCFDFQANVHPEHFCMTGLKNCTELWEKFSAAFIDKPQCNVTADLYTDFIEAANHNVTGKQLFYSGLHGFAQRYSSGGARYTTLEDTLIGYLIDGLSFCGGSAGQNANEQCEKYKPDKCAYTASGSFWEAASVNFAQNAAGHVYALLTTAKDPIVKNTSYFRKYEVPQLQSGGVLWLTVIVINDSPSSKRNPCSSDASLKLLKSYLSVKNIIFKCEENPSDLVHLFCMDNPSTELCQNVNLNPVSTSSNLQGHFFFLCFAGTVAILNNLKK